MDENLADLRRLDLRGRERAIVSSDQMILRSGIRDLQRLTSRIDTLRRRWERNGRADRPAALLRDVFGGVPDVRYADQPCRGRPAVSSAYSSYSAPAWLWPPPRWS